jgi:hypothetical protein
VTNVLVLPQLSGSLIVATNADLRVAVQFVQAGTTNALDLTGIDFVQEWRLASQPSAIGLRLTNANGLLVNGGANGTLSWLVPEATAKEIEPGAYVADLLAIADGAVVNLFQNAPLTVTVNGGVTCSP